MADITKIPSRRFQGHRERVRALAWNADGRRLASGSLDHSVRIWVPEKDTKTSTEMRGHSGEASIVRWDPTHPEHLASCSGCEWFAIHARAGILDQSTRVGIQELSWEEGTQLTTLSIQLKLTEVSTFGELQVPPTIFALSFC